MIPRLTAKRSDAAIPPRALPRYASPVSPRLAALLAHPRVREARARVGVTAAPLRDTLRATLRARADAHLAARTDLLEAARAEADALAPAVRAAETRVAATLARLDRSPVTGATTVHAAHARHPGVQALFARRGLPRCTDCAVGADETLAEAAFGEDFALDALLSEIHALLSSP